MNLETIVSAKQGKIITPIFERDGVTRVEVECAKGHRWTPRVTNLRYNNSWCPVCGGTQSDKIESLHAWAQKLGGKCLSTDYHGNKKNYEWACGKCKNQWEATWNNVKGARSWCPECKTSIREIIVRESFRENFPNESFDKNRTAIGMELDGYSEEQCLAFEHDGIQHRVRVPHFQRKESDFEAQLTRDSKKDDLCEENEITLIRVPDRGILANTAIRGYVREQLEELGYDLPATRSSDQEFFASVQAVQGRGEYLEKARQLAGAKNGVLLSDCCPTWQWPLFVRCCEGHVFETNYDNLQRGRGCPQCAHNAPKSHMEIESVVTERGYQLIHTDVQRGKDNLSRRFITVQCPRHHDPSRISWANFRSGKGCKRCGKMRTGISRRCSRVEITVRLQKMRLSIESEYQSINKSAIFRCQEDHRFRSTLCKLEMLKTLPKCPVCVARALPNLTLLDQFDDETDPVKTKLRWQ